MLKYIMPVIALILSAMVVFADENKVKPAAPDMTPVQIKILTVTSDDAFIKLAVQEYAVNNPDRRVNITACPSAEEAFKRLDSGNVDLIVIQLQKSERKPVFSVLKPFAAIVNSANQLENISSKRLSSAFAGGTSGWSDLGGAKIPLKIITFPGQSADGILLCQLLGIPSVAAANRICEDGGRAIVALTAYDINTLACVPVEYVTTDVKILKVDGFLPDHGNIASGKYPLVARIAVLQSPHASPETVRLVEMLRGNTGENVCQYLSLIPAK